MVQPVQMWKSVTGKLFDSKEKAEQWDKAWEVLNTLFKDFSETQRNFMYRRLLEMVEAGWQFIPPERPSAST